MQVDVIHRMLASSYWSPRVRRDVVEAALANSLVAGAFHVSGGGQQVGIARVVTDYATFAWLCDVFVHESHRGHGLGKRLVGALLAEPRLQAVRKWCLATRDAHGLYRQFGFAPLPEQQWMERKAPASTWQELGDLD